MHQEFNQHTGVVGFNGAASCRLIADQFHRITVQPRCSDKYCKLWQVLRGLGTLGRISIYLPSITVFVYPRLHGVFPRTLIGVRNLKGKQNGDSIQVDASYSFASDVSGGLDIRIGTGY
jgi:hypothetical protein